MPYADVTFALGECPSDDKIRQIFENLETFAECGDRISSQFKCARVDRQSDSAPIGDEICFTIQQPNNVSPSEAAVEEKILFLDRVVSFSQGANGAEFNPNRTTFSETAKVFCDGVEVATLPGNNRIETACFACSTLSEIEICVETNARNPTASGTVVGTATVTLCGALVCVGEVSGAGLQNYFMPPYKPCGKYDRMFLHAVLQNLRLFSSVFANFGQVPSCADFTFPDADDHVVLFNSPATTEYLVLGSVTVCARNTYTETNGRVFISPRASCAEDSVDCNRRTLSLPAADEGNGPGADVLCLTVPVVFCGTCPPGTTLQVGFDSRIDCEGEESGLGTPGNGVEIVSVEQNYCTFLFQRTANEFSASLPTGLPKCVPLETFQAISTAMQEVDAACENLRPIDPDVQESDGVAGAGDVVTIAAAQPWPPVNDPLNTDPPPIKKRWLDLTVRACFTANISSDNSGGVRLRGEASVLCGGVELKSEFGEVPLTETFLTRPRCVDITIQCCVECPIDEDLTIEFSAVKVGGSDGSLNTSSFEYDYKTICY